MTGTASSLPRASREHLLAAVSVLEAAGPVTVGQIALRVAEEMDIDMRGVRTPYDLRRVMSWQGLQTDMRHLVESGALVRRTEQQWAQLTGGLLFTRKPSPTTWAYCTPAGSRAVRQLAGGGQTVMRRLLAEQYAVRWLAARHQQEYDALVQQWMDDNPAKGAGA